MNILFHLEGSQFIFPSEAKGRKLVLGRHYVSCSLRKIRMFRRSSVRTQKTRPSGFEQVGRHLTLICCKSHYFSKSVVFESALDGTERASLSF